MTRDQVVGLVEKHREAMIELLKTFVNIDTGAYTIEGVKKLTGLIEDFLKNLGFSTESVESGQYAPHLLARKRGRGKKKLLMLAHMDTVFEEGTAAARPFRIEGGKAYGPGVLDMQSGIVCLLYAMKVLTETGFDDYDTFTLLFNSDEERGSATSERTILDESAKADAVLVFEPGNPPDNVCIERKGGGIFNLEVWGRAAHAGDNPQGGIHALEEMAHKLLAMHAETDYSRMRSISVGVVKGGTRSNIIPDYAFAEIDVRCKTDEDGDYLMRRMQEIADRSYVAGTTAKLTKVMYRPPLARTPENTRLYELFRKAGEELGCSFGEKMGGGGSDGNYASGLGKPVIDSLGPVGEFAHTDAEYVVLESLFDRTKANALFIQACCGQA